MPQNVASTTITRAGPRSLEDGPLAIEAEGLVKYYGETAALDGLDLAVPTGTVLGMLGPNGSGKTTAVRILATLVRPDEGRVTVAGHDLLTGAHEIRGLIGLTGQYAAVDEGLTGSENLQLIGRLLGLSRRAAKARAAEMLERFSLTDVGNRPAKTYSGGMRRRLDLGASLVGNPRLLYLDEPTTGLDPRSRIQLWDLIRGLVADGVTVLLTTQYLEEADALADNIVVVDHGRVIARGTPDELKSTTGAQTLTIKAVEKDQLETATRLLADITGAEPKISGQVLSAQVTDPAILPATVRRFEEAGVAIGELSLRSASLDEVFLSLTGRPAVEETQTTEDEE